MNFDVVLLVGGLVGIIYILVTHLRVMYQETDVLKVENAELLKRISEMETKAIDSINLLDGTGVVDVKGN